MVNIHGQLNRIYTQPRQQTLVRGYLGESGLWACLGGIVFAEVGGPSLQAAFPGEVAWTG